MDSDNFLLPQIYYQSSYYTLSKAVTVYGVVELCTELLKDCKGRVESNSLSQRGGRGEGEEGMEARGAEGKDEHNRR